ncbi:MAG TPA: transcription factor TFIIB [Nitrosopumilaceae archaeon]|nr:transcription factor TFIIB [Nitrosopumilaceae archaeon]
MIFSRNAKDHSQDSTTHGPVITDNVSGEILCGRCGLVLVEKVEDPGLESIGYTTDQYLEKSRTGMKSTLALHDRGLATMIDAKDKDAHGNTLSSYVKDTFGRLRMWDTRSKFQNDDRSLRSAFVVLDTIKQKLELPENITERAAYLYRKALAKKLTRGRRITDLMLASIYTACREANTPRTLQDVANAGNTSIKGLSRHYRILVESLDLHIQSYDSSDFVTRISEAVGLSEKTRRSVLEILTKVKQKEMSAGKNPMALAAAAIYLASVMNMEGKSQKNLSKVSGISMVTIRERARAIKKSLGKEI